MQVLHCAPPLDPSWGGPFWSVRGLARSQVELGQDVQVIMPRTDSAVLHLDDWHPTPVTCHGRIRIPALGWSRQFENRVMESGADVLHTHGLWLHPSWVARRWKSRLGRPHVVSVRGMLEPWAFSHRRWKKWPVWHLLEKANLRTASLLHATSESEAATLRAIGLETPIAVIPNGVPIPPAASGPANPRGSFKAVFIGRIHPVKGLDRLLQAWRTSAKKNWTLQIAGPDEAGHLADLMDLCHQLGLKSQVTFSGPVGEADKRKLLNSADLFVAPSHTENFGIAIAEALAHGVPTLTTQGTPWEVLRQVEAGWWTENSALGIAQGLAIATSTPREELRRMGVRGRNLARTQFGWESVGARFVDSYRWLLDGGEAPAWVSLPESP